jgi:hypothetical protein
MHKHTHHILSLSLSLYRHHLQVTAFDLWFAKESITHTHTHTHIHTHTHTHRHTLDRHTLDRHKLQVTAFDLWLAKRAIGVGDKYQKRV